MRDDETFLRDLDWNLLKVFDEIVRSGGVSAAARQLGRNQPAVSLALKRFEQRMGTTLCQRGPGGFELLVEGELVAEICREIAQLAEDLPSKLADITKTVRGVLHIRTLCDVVCCQLDESLRRFNMRYPNVQIQTDIGAEDTIVQIVLHNQTDIGIDTNRVQIAGLVYEPLFREVHQAFCGRDFHLFGKRIRGLADHADEPFLLTEIDEPEALKKFRAETGVGCNTVARSNNLAELRRMAILGLGICFLPDHFAAPDVEAGRLWPLTPDCRDWGLDIYMITNPNAPRQQLPRLFIEEVRSVKAETAQASS